MSYSVEKIDIIINEKILRFVMKRTFKIENEEIEVLKVPWYSQSEVEYTCFVYSFKMCMEYFKNEYIFGKDAELIKDKIPDYTIQDIKELTHTRDGVGTIVSNHLCSILEKKFPFKFTLKYDSSFSDIKENLNKNLPVIVIYDATYLDREERGGGHAGVVIGMSEEGNLVLNNPWFGAEYFVERVKFERAWELEYNRAFFMKPSLQKRLFEGEK